MVLPTTPVVIHLFFAKVSESRQVIARGGLIDV
jgi:hypothetical protein